MIDIALPSWFPDLIIVILLLVCVCLIFYIDLIQHGGVMTVFLLAFLSTFLIIIFVVWVIMSVFGLLPQDGLIPPLPQIFNISVGTSP